MGEAQNKRMAMFCLTSIHSNTERSVQLPQTAHAKDVEMFTSMRFWRVWGVPTRTTVGTELFAANVRSTRVSMMPEDDIQFLGGPLQNAFMQLLNDVREEAVRYARALQRGDDVTALQACSSSVVWEYMNAESQTAIRQLADKRRPTYLLGGKRCGAVTNLRHLSKRTCSNMC